MSSSTFSGAVNDVSSDELHQFDLSTGNHLIVIVYNEHEDSFDIENPSDLPSPMVRGLLEQALDHWRDEHSQLWVSVDDEDE